MEFVWEHNGADTLLYSIDCVGAYTRGDSLHSAIKKMQNEIATYSLWNRTVVEKDFELEIVQEKESSLLIADADSDVLFHSEKKPLSLEEYNKLKTLALKSANDFYTLYNSAPNKQESCLPYRNTFYGAVPRTAQEMYEHTKNVNDYYFGEIGISADNEGTIVECRLKGFNLLEQSDDFLRNPVVEGSYGELWSLRKVFRRFLWHDRIHAKAMYRMLVKTFGTCEIKNTFLFSI